MKITKKCKRNRKLLKSFLLTALYLFPLIAMAQTRIVGGVVTDQGNEPLIGVSVVIKGTTTGTLTDTDGKYTINVPDKESVLVLSYIGYVIQEQKVGERTAIDVVLQENNKLLDEVVVVGYGVQKKINLTGAVSAVDSRKLENRATTNLSSSLSGLASGVTVKQSSGKPGSDEADIRIRGIGTFNKDYLSPLIIVDGSEASISSVNPDDVESISFLKDAASASIYGSRGANGVVLITTKRGKKGEAPRITYSGIITREKMSGQKFNFGSSFADYMELYNLKERLTMTSVDNLTNGTGVSFPQELINEWRAAEANPNGIYTDPETGNQAPNWLAYPTTNWVDYLFQSATTQKHNISVAGGGDKSNYLLSFNYLDNPGTLENTGLKRYQGRINLETRITDFLRVGTQTYATFQKRDPGNTNLTYLFQTYPSIMPKYNGQYGGSDYAPETNNLLKEVAGTGGYYDQTRLNTTWFAGVDFGKGLTGEVRFNYQTLFDEQATYGRHIDLISFRSGKVLQAGSTVEQATTTRATTRYQNNTTTATLNYMKSFGSHDITALLGFERYQWNKKGFTATRTGLLDFDLPDFNAATDKIKSPTVGSSDDWKNLAEQDYGVVSYFGRINYAYKNRYLMEANFRRDGSSRFGPDYRWGTFPSFSLGWRPLEEDFMESARNIFSNLKLRGSWGRLGNTTSGYYEWQATYSAQNYAFGDAIYKGLAKSKLANPLLHWEAVTSTDIGLDLGFLDNRLTAEADYYVRKTKGILASPSMYLTMGTVSAPTTNTSDMANKGFEITLGWKDKIKDFSYAVSANFSYNRNEVTKYKGVYKEGWETDANGNKVWVTNRGETASIDGNNIVTEGHPYNEYYIYSTHKGNGDYFLADGKPDPNGGPRDGMIRTKADLDWVRAMIDNGYSFNGQTVGQGKGLWYGERIYADLNGDGKYGTADDRYFSGKNSVPKYSFGFNLSAEWKGFDLSMTWAGNAGFSYVIYSRGFNIAAGQKGDVMPMDAYTNFYRYDPLAALTDANYDPAQDPKANVNAIYPRLGAVAHLSNETEVYNASYIKLKTLQIGYTIPKKWAQKVYVNNLRVFFSGENLLTITDFPGVDPEYGGSGYQTYPIPRMLSAGINITF
ncbi:SusC/RagA family TonB-linked outer membrane protein [Dysgonomonas termitidis]|uniref:SusC/RagA family TonB-linked outer membrane protein n=1 Tax=Dysgonomonas termitidis TaxID=1516126 RepID=A0ABV9KQI2_9BACT